MVPMKIDNLDTDQIIPARFLKTISKVGLGDQLFCDWRYDAQGYPKPDFILNQARSHGAEILLAGDNFGCGSSREHAPIALGAAGCEAVVAESFARIFFRNSVATGELYPVESTARICETVKTGDEVELDLDGNTLKILKSANVLATKPLGEARPVIDAGGLFDFARQSGMIKSQGNHSKATEKLAAKEPADD
jgi:3-isopropylmalate/(R)-2-methylmalate dehydratase small subunit